MALARFLPGSGLNPLSRLLPFEMQASGILRFASTAIFVFAALPRAYVADNNAVQPRACHAHMGTPYVRAAPACAGLSPVDAGAKGTPAVDDVGWREKFDSPLSHPNFNLFPGDKFYLTHFKRKSKTHGCFRPEIAPQIQGFLPGIPPYGAAISAFSGASPAIAETL